MTIQGDIFRWFYGRIFKKPSNFSWVIPNKLAGSALMRTRSEFDWIITQGIRSIVTIREIPLPAKYFEISEKNVKVGTIKETNKKIDYLHLQVKDNTPPSLDVLVKTVDYIQNHIENGKPVLVHCNAGRGRTGVILTAYLMKTQNLSRDEALIKIKETRKKIPAFSSQLDMLTQYEHYIRKDIKKP